MKKFMTVLVLSMFVLSGCGGKELSQEQLDEVLAKSLTNVYDATDNCTQERSRGDYFSSSRALDEEKNRVYLRGSDYDCFMSMEGLFEEISFVNTGRWWGKDEKEDIGLEVKMERLDEDTLKVSSENLYGALVFKPGLEGFEEKDLRKALGSVEIVVKEDLSYQGYLNGESVAGEMGYFNVDSIGYRVGSDEAHQKIKYGFRKIDDATCRVVSSDVPSKIEGDLCRFMSEEDKAQVTEICGWSCPN